MRSWVKKYSVSIPPRRTSKFFICIFTFPLEFYYLEKLSCCATACNVKNSCTSTFSKVSQFSKRSWLWEDDEKVCNKESPTSPQNVLEDELFHFHTSGHASTPVQPTSRRGIVGLATLQPSSSSSHSHFSERFKKNQEYYTPKWPWVYGIPHTTFGYGKRKALSTFHILRFTNLPHSVSIFMFVLPLWWLTCPWHISDQSVDTFHISLRSPASKNRTVWTWTKRHSKSAVTSL